MSGRDFFALKDWLDRAVGIGDAEPYSLREILLDALCIVLVGGAFLRGCYLWVQVGLGNLPQ